MMSLTERITADMKEAMKSKNNATLSTLRLLRCALKNKQIDLQHELSDEEVLTVIKSQVKQLKDSLALFESAGRAELAQGAGAEIVVLENYLPAQMSDDDLERVVKNAIEQTGASGKQDMGKVMGVAVKATGGAADGARVKAIVEKFLPVIALVLLGTGVASVANAAIDIVPQQLSYYSFFENGVRIVRVLLLWFGLLAVNMILRGGFIFMVSSMRDDIHKEAWGNIAGGLVGAVAVIFLYSAMTIVLGVM